jgi:hypothetical protein
MCDSGSWSGCVGAVYPVSEICGDNIDNNCDGQVDEGCKVRNPAIITPVKRVNPAQVTTAPGAPAQLNVQIVGAPRAITATDPQFGVQARVTNVGQQTLPNVVADASSSGGWKGERVLVGTLEPNESRIITAAYQNTLCPDQDVSARAVPDGATLTVRAHSGEIADVDNTTLPVQGPDLGVIAKPLGDRLRACIVIDNKGRPARDKLEVELEVYDQKKDDIVDLLSPVRVAAGQTLLTVRDYPLSEIPVPKLYHVRANMYENGSLFEAAYHVAETRSTVDLTNVNIPARPGFWAMLKQLFGVFA